MNDVTLAHPDQEQLTAFAQGRLGEVELSSVHAHLGECAECRTKVEATGDDTLVALLRAADTKSDTKESKNVTDAVTIAARVGAVAPPGVTADLAQHGRYRVQELLGVGGMGAVYKAEHLLMERPVALKLINHALTSNPAMIERFRREMKTAGQLRHPNIVMAHDAEQVGDAHFLVMEYVEGTSLARVVADRGPLPVREACAYVRQAAAGLQYAHERGMVHRDIKPQNLMLTPDGEVKILDFGLARFAMETAPQPLASLPSTTVEAPGASLTQIGVVMGTPDYIAPEQARDAHTADIRADIYSLGCTLYDLLAGHAPFSDGTVISKIAAHRERTPRPLTELRSDVPPSLGRVVARMMAKDPAGRYQTPAAVAEALHPFASSARPRSRGALVITAAVMLLGVLGIVGFSFSGTVYRIVTNQGELTVEVNDPQIKVMLEQNGITVHDGTNHFKVTIGQNDLKAGHYKVEVKDPRGGSGTFRDEFTLTRNGKAIVKVTFAAIEQKDLATVDRARLQGAWRGVAGFAMGQRIPDEHARQLVVKFSGDTMETPVSPGNKGGKGTFKLYPHETPKQIKTTENQGGKVLEMWGVYGLDGDTLRICMSAPEHGKITEFGGKVGLDITLRREKSDYQLIQGTWKGVSVSAYGQTFPDLIFEVVGPTITFAADKVTWKANPALKDKDLANAFAKFALDGVFHLDPTKSPRAIDLTVLGKDPKTPLGTPAPRAILGIYRLDGDKLELCVVADPDRAEERPTTFATAPGKNIIHLTLKRVPSPP
jgi:uncharacterized protein (TIGR03067 family)